jgi:hypothetical protein
MHKKRLRKEHLLAIKLKIPSGIVGKKYAIVCGLQFRIQDFSFLNGM